MVRAEAEIAKTGEGEKITETNDGEHAPALPFMSNDTFAILFDAGLPGMPLLGCSSALVKSGVGESDEGMLQLVPDREADNLDNWVFTEVQNLEESGDTRSSHDLTTLRLVLPKFIGQEFQVKSAWLEVPPGQMEVESEDSIPMVLKVHGLTLAAPVKVLPRRLLPSSHTRKAMARRMLNACRGQGQQQLESVPEADEEGEQEEEEDEEEEETDDNCLLGGDCGGGE